MGGGLTDRTPIQAASFPPSVSMCLNAGGMGRIDAETETLIATTGGVFDVAHSLKADGFDASEDGTGRGTPIVPVVYPINTQVALRSEALGEGTGMGIGDDGAPAYTLQAGHSHAIAFDTKGSQVQTDETGATPTLRSMAHDGSHQNGGGQLGVMTLAIRGRGDSHNLEYREDGTANAVLTPNGGRGGIGVGAIATTMAVRRLTPLECTRLQGFPDDYFNIPGKPFADGPIYKMLGNSMAVNVMRWIGERIQSVKDIAA